MPRPIIASIFLAAIVAAMPTRQAQAVVLSINDTVFGLNSVTRDMDNNLDWLDWTLSTNRSFNDVSTQFGVGGDFEGWRHATDAEVLALYQSAGISGAFINQLGQTNDATVDALEALLGQTDPGGTFLTVPTTFGVTSETHTSGNPLIAYLADNSSGFGGIGGAYSPSAPASQQIFTGPDSTDTFVGHALVRDFIPEPNSLLLGAVGILGCFLANRHAYRR